MTCHNLSCFHSSFEVGQNLCNKAWECHLWGDSITTSTSSASRNASMPSLSSCEHSL